MRQLLVFLIAFLSISCSNYKMAKYSKDFKFPDDWLGSYEGKMLWYAGNNKKAEIPIRIEISITEDPNRLHWKTTYDSTAAVPQKIVKDYFLISNDSLGKNHFILDENNGIFIDQILIDNTLYSSFEIFSDVQNGRSNHLISIDRLVDKNQLYHEVISYKSPDRKSGDIGESKGYTIKSSSVINTQKAVLYRVKGKK
jgi:hypothetical protein